MKNLRKLSATAVLTCVLASCAFAGETSTPPCASTDPGETHAPPCVAAPGDIDTPSVVSTAAGDMGTATVRNSETSFTEIAADVLLNLLPLF